MADYTLAEARKLFALALEAELPPTVRLTPEDLAAMQAELATYDVVPDDPAHSPDRSGQCFPDDYGMDLGNESPTLAVQASDQFRRSMEDACL